MSKVCVRVLFKDRELSSQTFRADAIVIGRGESCDVRLDNAGVSREHARIERQGPGYLLRDLGSANGTFVGDEKVSLRDIEDGDRARISKYDVEIRLVDQPQQHRHDPDTMVPGAGEQETIRTDEPGLGRGQDNTRLPASGSSTVGAGSWILIALGGCIAAVAAYMTVR